MLRHSTFVRDPVLFGEITRLPQAGEGPVPTRSFGHFEVSGPAEDHSWRYIGRVIAGGAGAVSVMVRAARFDEHFDRQLAGNAEIQRHSDAVTILDRPTKT